MALHALQSFRFGLKKESARGTAETTPDKWYAIDPAMALNYSHAPLPLETLWGTPEKRPMQAGPKTGEGSIPFPLDAQIVGELFYSLLGGVSSAQQGGTAAYKHTITRSGAINAKPSYTFFMDRGLGVLKYNLGVVRSISINVPVDNFATFQADVLFKSEASGSIGSPTFPSEQILSFQHADIEIAGSSDTDVKEFSLTIEQPYKVHRTLNQSQDAAELLATGPIGASGSFVIYFQSTTERSKFLANTSTTLRLLSEGEIIASTYKYTVDINLYQVKYTAFPYGEDEGLLAAQVEFQAEYSSGDSQTLQVDVTNTDTSY